MSDWTINDTMAKLDYELSERKIYNDVRSEIGIVTTETVLDQNEEYSWKKKTGGFLVSSSDIRGRRFYSSVAHDPVEWKLFSHEGLVIQRDHPEYGNPYYDYDISVVIADSNEYATVQISNNGILRAAFDYVVGYKYLSQDRITHEEQTPLVLSVRATDADSIAKYGRRVMNLTWSEGTERDQMQILVDAYLMKYKEPIGIFHAGIIGDTDIKRTQIYTREISDIITVVCSRLGANVDCYINGITIRDNDPVNGLPICEWILEVQRPNEALSLFTLDTSSLDGADILAA